MPALLRELLIDTLRHARSVKVPATQETLDEIALNRAEYEAITDRLGREPDPLELGLFGALWSEHCGYKHTKNLLRTLPRDSERLLVAPGAENAGVVDIGDGYSVAMKIESHNHPSAVEPYEGAATGVGGIVRDIFAMGARPVALLNSLRFGPPESDRNRHLINGVVAGISGYGNCIGVPDVGGEILFDDRYSGNPLVNAMCVGLLSEGKLMSASADAAGDLLVLVGAKTGRDGIHGASGLASRSFAEEAEMRSAVQVGNPFLEKVLIEACLEAIELPGVVGMQDCGAAGITSAAVEMAERSDLGIEIDVAKVPRRESGMTPYEAMLSESQERMLLAVKPGSEQPLFDLFEKWDLDASIIGTFTDSPRVSVLDASTLISSTPVSTLTDAPEYHLSAPKPKWLDELQSCDLSALKPPKCDPSNALLRLLASPNIASKKSVWRQYDHQVQNNTVVGPGGDAALLRIKGTSRGIAVSTDGNGRLVYLAPRVGAAIAVAEACRNVSCVGAEPVALTDGLNFGNPEKPDIQYQLIESINGISDAASALKVPVVSGNASLYNESSDAAIFPTPIIGALGVMDDVTRHVGSAFMDEGDAIVLIGASSPWDDAAGAACSEALELFYGMIAGEPRIDLDLEVRVQSLCRHLIWDGLAKSAHDCSDGGLAVAVAESSILGGLGAMISPDSVIEESQWHWSLFGETQSRIVLSAAPSDAGSILKEAEVAGVPAIVVGEVGGDALHFGKIVDIPLSRVADAWENGFERALSR